MAVSGVRVVARATQRWLGFGALVLTCCGRTKAPGEASGSGGSPDASQAGAPAHGGATNVGGTNNAGGVPGWFGLSTTPPLYTRVQRLTNSQFEHAVIDILRLPKTTDLAGGLVPAPLGITDFTNNEQVLDMSLESTSAFELAAEKAAALATDTPAALSKLYAGSDPAGFIAQVGRRAFRRPLTAAELERYGQMFTRGQELYGESFASGAALVIRAMLSSPSFLYRSELGPVGGPLTGYEIAAKLSFWLLDTTPSDALLDAAEAGELDQVEGVTAVAREMLETPEAAAVMRSFHHQMYRLRTLDFVTKQNVANWSAGLVPEAKEASERFFDRIFSADLGVRDIFASTRGFVGPLLAPLYLQSAPEQLEERELGPERLGYFMQVPWLMAYGRDAEPATIERGYIFLQTALCATLGPPSLVAPTLPPLAPGQTSRQRASEVTSACGAACHAVINPPGFAFEGFDGMGMARDTENGSPIDASGSLACAEGEHEFADAHSLMTLLADDRQPYVCYGQRLASYGLQRNIVEEDRPLLDDLADVGQAGTVKDIVMAVVQAPAFRLHEKDSR